MLKDIYDPLTEYVNVFKGRFKEVAEATFADLAQEAKVDVEANRETCRQIYSAEEKYSSVKARHGWWIALCVILWLIAAGGAAVLVVMYDDLTDRMRVSLVSVVSASLLFLFFKVHLRIRELKAERKDLASEIEGLKRSAWEQMAPLNRLYDWDILTRMMSQTVSRLEFDPYFTTQRLADLKMTYGWDDSFNAKRSVISSHSGLINGNPFVLCRTRKMEMGTKTYYGSKTIHWTSRERGPDGKYQTVHHSQVLTASVTADYPEYFEKTRLIYGNTAAPDLVFTRRSSGLAGREGSLSYKRTRRALRKKARNLTDADFAMMTNEDFEVSFDTRDRNDNQQFALLFTPLAQESMLKLLKDDEVGFGDDFDFCKNRMINMIIPEHLQGLNLDMNPEQYRHFDFDRAEADFFNINARYFRAIYFAFAPLLCVPMYQQIRPQDDIYGHDMQRRSAFWEHESLANFWGQDHFKHQSCVTDCILKTEQAGVHGDNSTIKVYAYGHRVQQRLTNVPQWGGDGRMHNVPVYWDEYIPVTGNGIIHMKEDNGFKDGPVSQRQRLSRINSILGESNLTLYRRHIASKV